jgi:nucleolin
MLYMEANSTWFYRIAYIEFKDPDSLDKAYQLNASDLGGYLLYVDEAYDRQ